ncbi:unnamed protein product [Linum tenue]|uniref:Agenet domain-containing protein n=1 Tax=Linum tenue TaxID=586396 RepID=A0AAV0HB41_9ROSI|nr:unnamed protein product [Linum tenue]
MSKSKTSSSSWLPHFNPGDRVEISSDEPGFRGSWFAGTVIRREVKNPNRYVVQYDKLYEDESGEKLLQETVDWVELRPPPPPEKKKVQLKFGDEVEAFHSDGWWEGAITAEHADGKFAVFFRSSKEQIVFEGKELRLRREWVEGKWEPPFEQRQREKERSQEKADSRPSKLVKRESSSVNNAKSQGTNSTKVGKGEKLSEPEAKPNLPEEVVKFTQGMQVEVTTDDEGFKGAWFAATIIEPSGEDQFLIEYKTLTNDDDTEFLREEIRTCHIRPCPPETIIVDGFKVMDEVDAYYNECWWVGVIAKVLINCKYMVYFKDTDEKITFKQADLRPHQDWLYGKWVVPSKALKQ